MEDIVDPASLPHLKRRIPRITGPVARLWGYLAGLSLTLFVATGASVYVNLKEVHQNHYRLAGETARAFFSGLVTIRRWNAMHGGVYVPVTSSLRPNAYLEDPLRDLTTREGILLTKINPAHMTRLIAELTSESEGVQFRIASLRPVNPRNLPDAWERQSLERFEKGAAEASGLDSIKGAEHFRYMGRLITEQGCLECHAKHGYELGDVRGGISVSVPYAPYQEAIQAAGRRLVLLHAVVAGLGLVVIWGFGHKLGRNVHKLETANEELSELNQWLKTTASTDPLTGLPNRLFLDQTLEAEVARARRHAFPMAVMILDIDHFKHINDRYGHQAGDRVLRELAQLLQQHKRRSDCIARWGGEEFVLVAPHTDLRLALVIGDRLRMRVEGHQFSVSDQLSISMGVTEYRSPESVESLMSRADKALYHAKENGRNRVETLVA